MKFIAIDHNMRAVETVEFGWVQDENIYLQACNEDLPESTSIFQ